MNLTTDILRAGTGCTVARALMWLPPMQQACGIFAIDSPARLSMFLAQLGHESMRLQYVKEIWGPTPAQLRYEGRADLGNKQVGDGRRYQGRGLIQLTGRANYAKCRDGMRQYFPSTPDFEAQPEALELPQWAAMSAAWFWADKGLNALADAGQFETVTRRINGGLNGYDDRAQLWAVAKVAMGVAA